MGTGFREAAINDVGQIVGTAAFVGGSPEPRGFRYSGGLSGTIDVFGTFPYPPGTGIRPASDALDINSHGLVTGTASSGADITGIDHRDAYVRDGGDLVDVDGDLTALTGNDYARAINDAGHLAGSNQDNEATLFVGGSETSLLAGSALEGVVSYATDLNDSGQVTGATIHNASFLYDDGHVRVLPNLDPSAGRVQAKAINEHGDVVGWGDRGSGLSDQARGFVHRYAENASYILEDHTHYEGSTTPGLGDWERLRTAWAINDSGWIVGVGDRRFDGATFPNSRAYLLIPRFSIELAGDCSGNGRLTAKDLDCVATLETRDIVLGALGTVPGDLNGDGSVDFGDFLNLSANFGKSEASYAEGNIDLAGGVDFGDFLALSHAYGTRLDTKVSAVPESSSCGLLGLGLCVASTLRRRRTHAA